MLESLLTFTVPATIAVLLGQISSIITQVLKERFPRIAERPKQTNLFISAVLAMPLALVYAPQAPTLSDVQWYSVFVMQYLAFVVFTFGLGTGNYAALKDKKEA